jgi:DUF1680 family protein
MTLRMGRSTDFSLRRRAPGWGDDISTPLDGVAVGVARTPSSWATVGRTQSAGDRMEIRIRQRLRMVPVDRQRPDRVLVIRGPAVLVLESDFHQSAFRIPERNEDLEQ